MNLETQPVTEAVAEGVPVPLRVNVAPSERVGSHSAHSGPDGMRRDMVRVAHYLVDVFLLRRRHPYYEGASDVRAIPFVLSPEVQQEEVLSLIHISEPTRL